jgi:hypothetical protein
VAGSLYLRFSPAGVQEPSANQWAPDLSSHDPNPPLALEDMPVAQLDWPNPRGREFPLALRTHLQPTITTHDVVVERPPLGVPIPRASSAVAVAAQLMPQTVPPAPPPAPFAPLAWPNPEGRRFPAELRSWAQAPQQAPAAAVPVSPFDWPLPRGASFPVALRTFTAGPQPTPAATAAPFATTDWPLPARRAAPVASLTVNLLETTLAPDGTVTYPRAAVISNARRADGSVALGAQAQQRAPQITAAAALDLASLPKDWPNPRGAIPARELRTWSQNLLESTLAPAQAVPFSQSDWPLPHADRVVRQDARTNLLESTLAPAQPAPFAQDDWPNPTLARRLPDLTPSGGVINAGAPLSRQEYELPGRALHPIGLRTWSVNLLQGTLSIAAQDPLRPLDWPLPQRPGRANVLLTWTANPLENVLDPGAPLRPLEWTNPRGRAPLADYGWTCNLLESTLAPRPLLPWEIANPRGAVPSIALRTHISPARVDLIGQDRFFGPPGKAPVYDYPNPRGAARASDLRTHLFSLPPDVLVTGVVQPIYGFGARARIGTASGIDPATSIGSDRASAATPGIGSDTAIDPAGTIGSNNA